MVPRGPGTGRSWLPKRVKTAPSRLVTWLVVMAAEPEPFPVWLADLLDPPGRPPTPIGFPH